ncbi:MAG: CCA tRNA nucleotidyltransferase [Ruminococcus sp.]|nr:CCA tRNA nucleotidyltransferase [Ruminococcus sp.]
MINIPQKCKIIFEIFEKNGYECFAVGGCVRDALMGKVPADWDFTTNALPDDILRLFSEFKTIEVGKKYGTIAVVINNECFEITTYRVDGTYSDSRHPDYVQFSSSIEEDLSRRDFTINSMAYSCKAGLIDPFDGLNDIKNRIIRCTGEPKRRFCEDALRILRALRFSSVFQFKIEENTKNAIFECMEGLSLVHPNRLRKEFTGLLSGNPQHILLEYRDVLAVIIPEIKPMFDLAQNNPHHCYDVWKHTVVALSHTAPSDILRLAVFFHDVGKPYVKTTDSLGIDHFKKHQFHSEKIANRVLSRFCYPKSLISDVCVLIRYHDERFRNLSVDIKRVMGAVTQRLFNELLLISYADIMAQSEYQKDKKLAYREKVLTEAKRIINDGECYSLSQLAINGDDLVSLGYRGKEIGIILNTLLKMVIKGTAENTKESLIKSINSISLK